MPHFGTLHDFAFNKDIDDIRGTELYGVSDDKLGKIEDLIFDHTSGEIKYAVVDTGGWFSHKRFLVPADRIHAYDKDKDAFQVDLVKDHIERKFPRFDDAMLKSDNDWDTYERNYKRLWSVDPVQHRDDRVDLDVTPATVEPSAANLSGPGIPMGSLGEEVAEPNPTFDHNEEDLDSASLTPHRLAGKFPETIQSSDKTHMTPAHLPSRSLEQTRVGNERVPDRAWQENPARSEQDRVAADTDLKDEFPIDIDPPANPEQQETRSSADTGQWHPRMRRFEEVLKKNRVDVTASCASCKPAKDHAA